MVGATVEQREERARRVVRFAADALEAVPGGGPPTVLGWRRWTRDAQVVELATPDGRRWFAKRLALPRKWRREAAAYDAWSPHLGPAMPRLVARCGRRRLLLTEALPGAAPRPRDPAAYGAAGALLARVHALPLPAPEPGGWVAWSARVQQRTEQQLARVRRLGVDLDEGVVRAAVEELVALPPQPLVACHGDYLPRNWLLDGDRLAVLDFAESGVAPRGAAFARLHVNTAWQRPELLERLLAGYGRGLDAQEVRFVELHRALDAVLLQRWGAQRGSTVAVGLGARVLDAVAAGEPLRLRRSPPRRRRLSARRVLALR